MPKKSIAFDLENGIGRHDGKKLKRGIDGLTGVLSVSVNTGIGRVAVDYDTTGSDPVTIKNTIDRMGYTASVADGQTRVM